MDMLGPRARGKMGIYYRFSCRACWHQNNLRVSAFVAPQVFELTSDTATHCDSQYRVVITNAGLFLSRGSCIK